MRGGGQIHVPTGVSPTPGRFLKNMVPEGRGGYVIPFRKVLTLGSWQRNWSFGLTQRYVKMPARTKKPFPCQRPRSAGLLQTMHVPRDRSGVISPTYCHCIQFRMQSKKMQFFVLNPLLLVSGSNSMIFLRNLPFTVCRALLDQPFSGWVSQEIH